jgi:hypothetical protein
VAGYIIPREDGGRDEMTNMRSLCVEHERQVKESNGHRHSGNKANGDLIDLGRLQMRTRRRGGLGLDRPAPAERQQHQGDRRGIPPPRGGGSRIPRFGEPGPLGSFSVRNRKNPDGWNNGAELLMSVRKRGRTVVIIASTGSPGR